MNTHLDDLLAIRALVGRFNDAVNRRDLDQFRAVWADDGVWEIPGVARAEGADAIVGLVDSLLGTWEFFFQMSGEGAIDLEGDVATARWPMREIGRTREGKGYTAHGVNADRLARTGDGWRFTTRTWHPVLVDESDVDGHVIPLAVMS